MVCGESPHITTGDDYGDNSVLSGRFYYLLHVSMCKAELTIGGAIRYLRLCHNPSPARGVFALIFTPVVKADDKQILYGVLSGYM